MARGTFIATVQYVVAKQRKQLIMQNNVENTLNIFCVVLTAFHGDNQLNPNKIGNKSQ